MLIELKQARVIGDDGFLKQRTITVLRDLYGFTAFDRGGWCIRAGAWPKTRPVVPQTQEPMCLFGNSGSDDSLYITDERLLADKSPAELARTLRGAEVQELDVHFDPNPRVAQVVTTFHRGGAERVALSLAERVRLRSLIVALDAPRRSVWPLPRNAVQAQGSTRARRMAHALRQVLAFGTDIVHAHLLDADELAWFRQFARLSTAHNAAIAWPAGLCSSEVERFVGCAEHVTKELQAYVGKRRATTILNGVEPGPTSQKARSSLALNLLVVANARAQKRFDRWPKILTYLPHAVVTIAGDGEVPSHPQIRALGQVNDLAALMAQNDVLVSLSDYEGMSLAELEALQCGLPLALSRCPAHEELAGHSNRVTLFDADEPQTAAHAIAAAAASERQPQTIPAFSAATMARVYEPHYRQVLRQFTRRHLGKSRRHDLVLITNNFVTGGAQSSARRLLSALAERGLRVAAATIQEHPEHASDGFAALKVDKFAAPPAGLFSPEVTVEALLDWVDADRVVFWNVIPEHKVLFAEQWRDGALFDVSPGEMYFNSLQRYFARPRQGHPIATPKHYGALLDGMIVKYKDEALRAEAMLQAPTHVIANGVAVPTHFSRPQAGPFVVGTLARLSPDKKLEQVLAAFEVLRQTIPDARLLIGGEPEAGSEGYAAHLRAQHPQVEWLGHVRPDDGFFSRVHSFALIAEPLGCPNASLEAMAHGVPVVGTAAGGAVEQIVDGHTGYLVPRGDSRALGERLAALAMQPHLQLELSANARRHCQEQFSLQRMADRYWGVLA